MAKNRLEQIRQIELFLHSRFGLKFGAWTMRNGLEDGGAAAMAIIACNYVDVMRYLDRDPSLGAEPAWLWPDRERNGCLGKCRIADNPACLCSGSCFGEERCPRLRHFLGQRICGLAVPYELDAEASCLRSAQPDKESVLEVIAAVQPGCVDVAAAIFDGGKNVSRNAGA